MATVSVDTETLRDELASLEDQIGPVRLDYFAWPEHRRRVVTEQIGRAVEIRRRLGMVPYCPAGLSPVVSLALERRNDLLVVQVTHLNDADDDRVVIGVWGAAGLGERVPTELFDDYLELIGEEG